MAAAALISFLIRGFLPEKWTGARRVRRRAPVWNMRAGRSVDADRHDPLLVVRREHPDLRPGATDDHAAEGVVLVVVGVGVGVVEHLLRRLRLLHQRGALGATAGRGLTVEAERRRLL